MLNEHSSGISSCKRYVKTAHWCDSGCQKGIAVRGAEHAGLGWHALILAPLLRLLVAALLESTSKLHLQPRVEGKASLKVDSHNRCARAVTTLKYCCGATIGSLASLLKGKYIL